MDEDASKPVRVRIYGDSITKVMSPVDDRRYHSYASRYFGQVERDFGLAITNRSRFGATIDWGCSKLEDEVVEVEGTPFVLIEFGGNDGDFDWPVIAANPDIPHPPKTPMDEYLRYFRKMIRIVRECGSMPVLMTLPPIYPARYLAHLGNIGLDSGAILH